MAREASTALLRAAWVEELGVEQRIVKANDVMFSYFSFEPGGTFADRWCHAPELAYERADCDFAAAVGNAPMPRWGWAWAVLVWLGAIRFRRTLPHDYARCGAPHNRMRPPFSF